MWESYAEVDEQCLNLSNGMMSLDLCPEVEGEGRMWRFVGIWCANRPEWSKTELACMHCNVTTVGFYDAMGHTQVDFILK